jgi:protein SCO1/2
MTSTPLHPSRARRPLLEASLLVLALSIVAVTTLAAAGLGPRLTDLPQRWTDDRGEALSLVDLRGHRVIATMAYANCHKICPATITRLERLQRALDARGEHVEFLVFGYDPANESPADWHRYRARAGLERANWHFLSGSRGDTARLARQLGFAFWKYDDHVMHDARVVVFNDDGTLSATLSPDSGDWLAAL